MTIFWIFYLTQAVLVAIIAKSKGYSFVAGFMVALVLPFVMLLMCFFLKTKKPGSVYESSYHIQPKVYETRDIVPYESLEAMFNYWKSTHKRGLEARFIKPETLINWEWTIRRCTAMVKMLKTIHYKTPSTKYNVKLVSRSFWNNTSFDVEYDSNNYTLVVQTGLIIEGYFGSNTIPATLHINALNFLEAMIEQMKIDLPKDESDKVLRIFREIKSQVS